MKMNIKALDRIWVTSDTHAFHVNITRGTTSWDLSKRTSENGNVLPTRDFDHWQEMTEKMAENFNSVIPQDGILFHLGDWSFNGKDKIPLFREMLNVSEIHLITGNHDHFQERGEFDHLFASRQKYLELEFGHHFGFCLFHFPIQSWNKIKDGWFHLHGHQHWKGVQRFGEGKMMDVGVDGNNLFPYKLTDVIELLKDRKKYDENDHHTH